MQVAFPVGLVRRRTAILFGLITGTVAVGIFLAIRVRAGTSTQESAQADFGGFDPAIFRTARDFEIEGRTESSLSERERGFQFRDEQWAREATFVPIGSGSDTMTAGWGSSLLDPSGVLAAGKGSELLRKLAAHATVRTERTPEAYIRLIDADPGLDWNELDANTTDGNRRDTHVSVFFHYFLEEPFDPAANRRATLRRVWDGLARHEHLFSEVGIGQKGAAILVIKVRVPAELQAGGFSGKHALDMEYWRAVGTRAAMQFSRPRQDTPDALVDRPGITVAFSNILVRMGDGRIINWISRWHLDPETDEWTLDGMDANSPREAFIVS